MIEVSGFYTTKIERIRILELSRLEAAVPVKLTQLLGHILSEEFGAPYEGAEPMSRWKKV